MKVNNIAIFASGSGTNTQRIAEYFKNSENIKISYIMSNNKDAFVIKRAKKLKIRTLIFNRDDFYHSDKILQFLKKNDIEWIILGGFIWLIPEYLVDAFPDKIINIHPALLPKYGGKGMYGMNVHKAVIENVEKESGITIHYVNTKYDKGNIIFQSKCTVDISDTPELLAEKIHNLEYKYVPEVIEKLILGKKI